MTTAESIGITPQEIGITSTNEKTKKTPEELIDQYLKIHRGIIQAFDENKPVRTYNTALKTILAGEKFLARIEDPDLKEEVQEDIIRGTTYLAHIALSNQIGRTPKRQIKGGSEHNEIRDSVKILAEGNRNALEELIYKTRQDKNYNPQDFFTSIKKYIPQNSHLGESFEGWKKGIMGEYYTAMAIINCGYNIELSSIKDDVGKGFDLLIILDDGRKIAVDIKNFQAENTVIGIKIGQRGNKMYYRNGFETEILDERNLQIAPKLIESVQNSYGMLIVCRLGNNPDELDGYQNLISSTITLIS